MAPRIQLIRNATGSPSYAVIPWDDYRRLAEAAGQDAETTTLLARTGQSRGGEIFPAQIADRLRAGENVVKVFREWRGLTPHELAGKTGLGIAHIAQLEAGQRNPGSMTMTKLARALGVGIDALTDHG